VKEAIEGESVKKSDQDLKKIRTCPASEIACGCPEGGTQRTECENIANWLAEVEQVRQTIATFNY